jgi:tetratricopeptide (TPR) repeat protein
VADVIVTAYQKKMMVSVGLILLPLVVYWNIQNFGFINYDDNLYVTENDSIQSGLSIRGLVGVLTDTRTGNWHPVTMISHAVDWELFGQNAGGHHWHNLVLHAINTVLLFLLLNQMTGAIWRSAMVAALFAIHPINVESVAWVSERKNVLSTFFWFLTMLFYVWYVRKPGWKRYLPVFVCFALGLMSKPMLVTLPFVMLLMDYWPLNRTAIDTQSKTEEPLPLQSAKARLSFLILEKIPLFILTGIFGLLTLCTQNKVGAMVKIDLLPLPQRISNAIISYGLYIKKMFWPMDLSVFYPRYESALWITLFVLSLLLLLSVIALRANRKYPYLIVGWCWYLGTLVPVIGLVQVGSQSMADRYAYVPFIGLFVILVWWIADVARNIEYLNNIMVMTFLLFVFGLSVLCWQRCQLWGDSHALWNDVLKNHRVAFAYNMRGLAHASQGQYGLALADYEAALNIDGKFSEAFNNRGNLYVAIGKYNDALKDFEVAQRLKPQFADAYYNRGILYLKNQKFDAAIKDFTQAIFLDANNADYFNNRGVALRLKGQYEKAFVDFTQALEINRNMAEAYYNRGIILSQYGRHVIALAEYNRALMVKQDYIDAIFRRGVSYLFLGQFEDAAKDFRQVLNKIPNHLPALKNMGLVLQEMGRYEESAKQYRKILQINPDDQNTRKLLKEIVNLRAKENPVTKE